MDVVTFTEKSFNGKLYFLFSLAIYYFLEKATSDFLQDPKYASGMKIVSINIFSKRLVAFYIIKISTTPTPPTPHFPLPTSVIKTRLLFFDINFGRDSPFSKKNIHVIA